MRKYRVSYIERDGAVVSRHVLAENRHEAKRIAENEGCEDILRVRREHTVHFSIFTLAVVAVILVALVLLARSI